MHPVDAYQEAVRQANTEVFRRFALRGPYRNGTKEHAVWLDEFDRVFKILLGM